MSDDGIPDPDPAKSPEARAVELVAEQVAAAAEEAQGLLTKLLGPLATEVGELLALPLRQRRIVRTAQVLRRAEERVREAEREGEAERVSVPAKGAVPLLDAASLEDDGLWERYADLLANAALGRGTDDLASFAEILRQLGHRDAQLLQVAFNHHVMRLREAERRGDTPPVARPWLDLAEMRQTGHGIAQGLEDLPDVSCSWSRTQIRVSIDNLFRLGLLRDVSATEVAAPDLSGRPERISRVSPRESLLRRDRNSRVLQPTRERVVLSDLGLAFAQAVNPPHVAVPDFELRDP